MFKKYSNPQRNDKFKKALIELRGHKCECCLNDTWLNTPISLELHHIDGDRSNLELNNLQLLCPNCHSYTDNYCVNKRNSKISKISDEEFVKALKENDSIRQALFALNISDTGANYKRARQIMLDNQIDDLKTISKDINHCIKCGKPISRYAQKCVACEAKTRQVCQVEREELKKMIRSIPFTTIGKKFGVSDTTIRKWCDKHNLPRTVKEIKSYSDKEWE